MTVSQAKNIFWGGTFLSAIIFLVLTYNSLVQMPQRTHVQDLTPKVAHGKWIWQKNNCNDCHTILGIGGYYAPDVTKVMSYRDADWTKRFLNDPEKVWPAARKMPNLHLQDEEINDLNAILSSLTKQAQQGKVLFNTLGCSGCHSIGGIGGKIGPDLTDVGSKRSKEWIEQQIKDPKSHVPNSIMPSFADQPAEKIQDLVDYLSGLQ
jgi:nitric oxide reductase subunit C